MRAAGRQRGEVVTPSELEESVEAGDMDDEVVGCGGRPAPGDVDDQLFTGRQQGCRGRGRSAPGFPRRHGQVGPAERYERQRRPGGPVGLGGPLGAAEGETRHQTRLVSNKSAEKPGTRRQTRHQTRQQTRHPRCIVFPMIRTRCRLRPALQGLPRAHQSARLRGRRTLPCRTDTRRSAPAQASSTAIGVGAVALQRVGQVDLVVKPRRLVEVSPMGRRFQLGRGRGRGQASGSSPAAFASAAASPVPAAWRASSSASGSVPPSSAGASAAEVSCAVEEAIEGGLTWQT